jgi:hypothetical protein
MVLDLCKELGWEDRLRELWAETELETETREGGDVVEDQENEEAKEREEDEQVQAEIDALTAAVAESLKIAPSPAEKSPEEKSSKRQGQSPPPGST